MGIRGIRKGSITQYSLNILSDKATSKKANPHRELCLLAGKWLRNNKYKVPYVAVELVVDNAELPDAFGWNYWTTVLIEVKVSRSDFLADKKKPFRIMPDDGLGEFRYYCCPKGLIKTEELPEKWGLLYEDKGKLSLIKEAERQIANYRDRAEKKIYTSILRREGIKPQIFNYRK